ncbi:hypothetical protein D1867_03150 [Acidianus infernus]|uniref:Uncharacterized protein n=1 Tax=Acidianus infernus TaxID=12915 RepID=A0A6A9QD69_ACIIN|nr:hypothetical protein [Acidianus infernus]MUM64265.1 hypothetical protein [Acidianus infernus]
MKGLSAVIGMVFLLIVMIAVLLPLALTVTSTTSKEEENINAIQPLQIEVEEQMSEVNTENSPIGFYYCNVTGEALLVYYSSPPIPLNISYFLGYKGGYIQIIDPQPTRTTWNKYPALEYQIGNFNKLAMVTTLGNIIYADPMPHSQESSSSSYDPSYWVYVLKTPYTSYTNPSTVQICNNPSAITNDWKPCGINNAVLIVLKQSHKPLCINLTIHFTCMFGTRCRHRGDVGTTVGIYSGSFYGQIEFGNYFLDAGSGVWPFEGFQCILLNVSHGYVSRTANCIGLGVLTSCSYLALKTKVNFLACKVYNYLLNIYINCNCQIYIKLYEICNGKYIPIKLPYITPKFISSWCWFLKPLPKYEGNYNETEWGYTKCLINVPKSTSCVVPFGEIKAKAMWVGCKICGFCPVEYPYDPIGVTVEIMWGECIYVSGFQIAGYNTFT